MPRRVQRLVDEFQVLAPHERATVRNAIERSLQTKSAAKVTCLTGGTATTQPAPGGTDWRFDKIANIACGTWRETP